MHVTGFHTHSKRKSDSTYMNNYTEFKKLFNSVKYWSLSNCKHNTALHQAKEWYPILKAIIARQNMYSTPLVIQTPACLMHW